MKTSRVLSAAVVAGALAFGTVAPAVHAATTPVISQSVKTVTAKGKTVSKSKYNAAVKTANTNYDKAVKKANTAQTASNKKADTDYTKAVAKNKSTYEAALKANTATMNASIKKADDALAAKTADIKAKKKALADKFAKDHTTPYNNKVAKLKSDFNTKYTVPYNTQVSGLKKTFNQVHLANLVNAVKNATAMNTSIEKVVNDFVVQFQLHDEQLSDLEYVYLDKKDTLLTSPLETEKDAYLALKEKLVSDPSAVLDDDLVDYKYDKYTPAISNAKAKKPTADTNSKNTRTKDDATAKTNRDNAKKKAKSTKDAAVKKAKSTKDAAIKKAKKAYL